MSTIIALSGKMGSGKDYIAREIIVPWIKATGANVVTTAFADQLKLKISAEKLVPLADMMGDKNAVTRKLLQDVGTDYRERIGTDIWIRYMERWIELRKIRDGQQIVVITDCRYPNELEWVKSKGGVIVKINAPDRTAARVSAENCPVLSEHHSENEITFPFDLVIDNRVERSDDVRKIMIEFLEKLDCTK